MVGFLGTEEDRVLSALVRQIDKRLRSRIWLALKTLTMHCFHIPKPP